MERGGRRGGRRGGGGGGKRGGGGGRGRGGGGGGSRPSERGQRGRNEYEDEFDQVQATRQVKGEEEEYDEGAGFEDDDDEDKGARRMTKQFAWEEERMDEEVRSYRLVL